ncbi:MAG: (d)CMP kinase [Burkholderiaceae bacterium]
MTDESAPVVAIDGPTASGKGSVAHRVGDALGFHVLDSGALYRLTACAADRDGIDAGDEAALADCALALEPRFVAGRIDLDGIDVTEAIRDERIGNLASSIAAFPQVRAALLDRQRAFQKAPGLVADGRDMGTVVFPRAALKIFLVADGAARAARRHKKLIEKGIPAKLPVLLRELQERDARDASRSTSPLAKAVDAITIDSSDLDLDAVVSQVLELARQRGIRASRN